MIAWLLRRWQRSVQDAPPIDRRVPAVHYLLCGTYGPLLTGRMIEIACIWNGEMFASREWDCLHGVAVLLADAGAPDGTWALIDHAPRVILRGASLHELAAEGRPLSTEKGNH